MIIKIDTEQVMPGSPRSCRAAPGYRVACLVRLGRDRPGRFERARRRRRVRVRPGGRGHLALGDLGAQLGRPLGVQGGAQPRPHRGLLEPDVLPRGPGERGEQRLELRVAGVELVELGQYFLGFLLLAGGLVSQRVAVGQVITHDRPEVHLLQRLVLGLLDDELLGHLLAQRQLVLAGPGGRGRPLLQLGQHALDFLVVLTQDREHIRHLSSLIVWPVPLPSWASINRRAGDQDCLAGWLRCSSAAMVSLSSCQLFSNLARPSRSSCPVTSSKSTPAVASWSRRRRASWYRPVMVSPVTSPWSAKAARVVPGMVLTVPGATSSVTYMVSG